MNASFRLLTAAAAFAAIAMLALPNHVIAQGGPFRTAGEKITGEAYWPGRATTRYLQSAQSYTQDFQAHVARAGRPEPAVVAEVSKTLSGYLDEANKHLAAMKKDFAGDKETVAAVENIEKELANAVNANKAMIDCCKDERFDKALAMSCCTDLAKQLGKVHDEHVALMKKLSGKYAAKKAAK